MFQGSVELLVSGMLFFEVGNALRYKPDYDALRWRTALARLFYLHMKVIHLNESLAMRTGEVA